MTRQGEGAGSNCRDSSALLTTDALQVQGPKPGDVMQAYAGAEPLCQTATNAVLRCTRAAAGTHNSELSLCHEHRYRMLPKTPYATSSRDTKL